MSEHEEKAKALGTVSTLSGAGAGLGILVATMAGIALTGPAIIGGILGLGGYLVAKAVK